MIADIIHPAEVREVHRIEALGLKAVDRGQPRIEIELRRRRRHGNERFADRAGVETCGIADETDFLAVDLKCEGMVMPRVTGCFDRTEAQAFNIDHIAIVNGMHERRRNWGDGSPQAFGLIAIDAPGAVDELGRIDQVLRAELVDVNVRAVACKFAGGSCVIEVDMGDQRVTDVACRKAECCEARNECGQRACGAGFNEHRAEAAHRIEDHECAHRLWDVEVEKVDRMNSTRDGHGRMVWCRATLRDMEQPLLVSTWSFGQRGHAAAWPALASGGSAIDAVERVCEVIDADPSIDSVGFGGLPDARGRVSLDGCIMLSPARCGSACYVRRFMHPVSIARRIMEKTSHIMLAGDGADAFADTQGFLPADLLAADAQDAWQKWMNDHQRPDQSRDQHVKGATHVDQPRSRLPRPIDVPGSGGKLFFHPAPPEDPSQRRRVSNILDYESRWRHHDTIGTLAIDVRGEMAGACSTSGMPFKLPGRVGDSPIIGHGLYVDPTAGAATATGAGELVMGVCGSFLAVECMRRGASPIDALRETLQRIMNSYDLKPEHQVAMIALRPDGTFASAALRPGYRTSIRSRDRDEVIEPDLVMLPE